MFMDGPFSAHQSVTVPTSCAVHEYRHKTYKAAMMAQSQHHYFEKHHPHFYRWSDKLARMTWMARPIDAGQWFEVLASPVTSAAEFTQLTGGRPVLALSPSLLMMPSMFRPTLTKARHFDEQEWALLEPSHYVALLLSSGNVLQSSWVYFERAGPAIGPDSPLPK